MKRVFDIVLSSLILIFALPVMLLVALAIKVSSKGPVIHASKRVGRDNKLFSMYKFRTMRMDAPQLATHLMGSPEKYYIPLGAFYRKTSLDELPQLFNVLGGSMSIVGPRPALYNQDDLVRLRTEKEVHHLFPGITGWAQVNGRDDVSVREKVALDVYYLKSRSFFLDMKILVLTVANVFFGKNVSH